MQFAPKGWVLYFIINLFLVIFYLYYFYLCLVNLFNYSDNFEF